MQHVDHRKDLLVLMLCPIVAVVVGLAVPMNVFCSLLLFLGIPALYLSVRSPQYVKKTVLFSLVTIPTLVIIDYIAQLNGAWFFPESIFPYRLFGLVSFESIFWIALQTYTIVIFYEHFVNHHVERLTWHPRLGILLRWFFVLLGLFLLIVGMAPKLLYVPYAYLVMAGLFGLLPLVLEVTRFPRTTLKIMRVAPYFFYLHLLYEIVALKVGWWTFPGTDFIGWVSFFDVSFPFEEFFFWLVIASTAILSYYEFCDDDEK